MISYSDKAKKALAFFYRPFNDIDIYVEDTACRNMYEILFERMLNNKAKINRIFQIGSKYKVIEACRSDQEDSSRSRLYIIDGDFELYFGKRKPKLKHLYRLNVYCSENLLISQNACREIARVSLTNKSREEIETLLEYKKFINEITNTLFPLFVMYMVAIYLDPSIETVGFHVARLNSSNHNINYLDDKLIEDRITDIKNKLLKIFSIDDIKNYELRFNKCLRNIMKEKFISGKDYLLPLIHCHMKQKVKYKGDINQLKCHLAHYCELDIDPKLYRRIQKLAN